MLYRELPISQNPDDDVLGALVGRAKQGSAVAFAELVARVRSRIRWWADRVIHDDDEADDIAQQVLLKLHTRLREFEGRSRFTTWLYRMTVNTALNHRRVHRRRARLLRDAATTSALDVPERETRDETGRVAELLSAFASELSGREREVFEMADLRGMTASDIAKTLGVQPVSVRAALSRARRRIRLRILELHPHLLEEYEP